MGRIAKKVELSEEQRVELTNIVKKGTHSARKITRAKALLMMDKGDDRALIESVLDIDSNHYYRIKQRYFAQGLWYALEELPRSGQPRKVTPIVEAHISSIACSAAPDGFVRWTLGLINDKLVELKCVESISDESIRLVLKKVNSNHG